MILKRRFRLLWVILIHFLPPSPATAEEFEGALVSAAQKSKADAVVDQNTYTINFNNVSMTEFIRFVSKITGLNFVFEDTDVQFNVTIVSEDPVSPKNVMSALAQVLRMHDINLLEQENNVLLTKSKTVNQIATIVSGDLPNSKEGRAPIVTRVFRIKNANVNSVAAIIRPMTSEGALIEVSTETRQLIVTDITTNVDKIGSLLTSLDAPHTPLEVESYSAKNITPAELIGLTTQIVAPFAEGNPLIFVPQIETNSIFIVSTPYLIERAITVMEDLDIPPKERIIGHKGTAPSNVYVYKILHRSPDQIQTALTQVAAELTATGTPSRLATTIQTMKWIKDTNSLLFVGDEETIGKLKEMLVSIDTGDHPGGYDSGKLSRGFFLYKLQNIRGDLVLKHLQNLTESLPKTNAADMSLYDTINGVKWVKENNSLLITGSPAAIEQVKTLISEFDIPGGNASFGIAGEKSAFLIYKPVHRQGEELLGSLKDLATDLQQSGLSDPDLLQTIGGIKYVSTTNSLLITGTPETLEKVKELLANLDSNVMGAGSVQKIGKVTFLVYKLQHASGTQLVAALKAFANDLKKASVEDKELAKTLDGMKWIKETNSILFTGSPDVLEKAEGLAQKFDTLALKGNEGEPINRQPSSFVLYSPKSLGGDELIEVLCDFMQNLLLSGVNDPPLYDAINHLKWIEKTNSLLISGDEKSIGKIQELLARFDLPSREASSTIESFDTTSFLVYKLQYHQGNEIQNALRQVSSTLTRGPSANPSLSDTVNSVQWIQVTNSLMATGQPDVLTKLKELIQNLDVPLKQVFIEVLVIETEMTNAQNFGLQWGSRVQILDKLALGYSNLASAVPPGGVTTSLAPQFNQAINAVTTANPPTTGLIPFTTGFDLGVIGDLIFHKGKSFVSLASLVNALQQDTTTTIVMNPKIIAQDNNQSVLFVGQNIPFVGSLIQNNTGTVSVLQTQNIEYRDVGVSLTIRPILGNNDTVTLDITHDITEQIRNTAGPTNAQLQGLQTSHTHMETRVHVPDHHFVVLSGMIHDSKVHTRTAIPCLGGLPVIGLLFSENDRLNEKNNVIIFLRPHIINSFTDLKQVTEHQEWLFKDQAALPVLKEEFDAGIDVVKTPENEK